eukprot:UC4_evm7s379
MDDDDLPPPLEDLSEITSATRSSSDSSRSGGGVNATNVKSVVTRKSEKAMGPFGGFGKGFLSGQKKSTKNTEKKNSSTSSSTSSSSPNSITKKEFKQKDGNKKNPTSSLDYSKWDNLDSDEELEEVTNSKPKKGILGDEDIPFIKGSANSASGINKDIQDQLEKGKNFLDQRKDEWLNDDLLKKIEKNPKLVKRAQDKNFMVAFGEFQRDPKEFRRKYGDSPEILEFCKEFMGLMGEHFTKLGEKEAKQKAPSAAIKAPPISKEQQKLENQMADALKRPDVQNALQDPRIQNLIHTLRENPNDIQMAQRLTMQAQRDPDMLQKILALQQAGLLGMQR